MRFGFAFALLLAAIALVCASCDGCKKVAPPVTASDKPSVRLYLLSDIAGALEPCGCSKDQLGGLDHLAAFVNGETKNAPNRLVLAAGPLLYIDPTLEPKRAAQDRWKAEAIADALHGIGLNAWVPGFNDWADGSAELARLSHRAEVTLLGGMHTTDPTQLSTTTHALMVVNGLSIGLIGIGLPRDGGGKLPADLVAQGDGAVLAQVKNDVAELRKGGARLLVGIAAMQRGAALRIADAVPELNVLLIGKEQSRGHGNTAQPAPELVGSTLVIETANHAQSVAVVDIYLKGADAAPKLADAGGVAQAAKALDLSRRIRELEQRINGWQGSKVDPADLAARKADLAKLRADRDALEAAQPAPAGSFFRFAVHEVREGMGKDDAVSARMLALYQRINTHNKTALADLLPTAAAAGEASFIGVEACTTCHEEERKVWDGTAHAHAYKTLADGFKEYNLECVGCHVSGYGRAGGSTVTHNDKLQNVQCEECHGAGSLHAKKPEAKGLIVKKPDPKGCVEACHHPPHVEGFDALAKTELILGPGPGRDK